MGRLLTKHPSLRRCGAGEFVACALYPDPFDVCFLPYDSSCAGAVGVARADAGDGHAGGRGKPVGDGREYARERQGRERVPRVLRVQAAGTLTAFLPVVYVFLTFVWGN